MADRCPNGSPNAVRDMVLFTSESPALVDACTVALLARIPT